MVEPNGSFSYDDNFNYIGERWSAIDLDGTKGYEPRYGELGRLRWGGHPKPTPRMNTSGCRFCRRSAPAPDAGGYITGPRPETVDLGMNPSP